MAVYDLEEQEKIDALKAWWKQWGNSVIIAVIAALAAYASVQGWRAYERKQTAAAGALYEALEKLAQGKDVAKVLAAARELRDKHPKAAYAPRAALLAAKASFDAGQLASAQSELEWAANNTAESELKATAQLRLASVLADQKKFAEALRALEAIQDPAFASLAADLKGDILIAQGKAVEAKSAYKIALERAEPNSGLRNLIQMKLDALGTK